MGLLGRVGKRVLTEGEKRELTTDWKFADERERLCDGDEWSADLERLNILIDRCYPSNIIMLNFNSNSKITETPIRLPVLKFSSPKVLLSFATGSMRTNLLLPFRTALYRTEFTELTI